MGGRGWWDGRSLGGGDGRCTDGREGVGRRASVVGRGADCEVEMGGGTTIGVNKAMMKAAGNEDVEGGR